MSLKTSRTILLPAGLWVALCLAVGVIGGVFSRNASKVYDALEKPPLSPPGWLFGPVWTVLYTMMGIAAFLVWRKTGWRGGRPALGLFLAQLSLNAVWTPVFFGLGRYGAAAGIIVLLLATIIATILAFWPIATFGALLLVPYLLWVMIASYLNISIWRLN